LDRHDFPPKGQSVEYGIKFDVAPLPTAKRGFALLPRRWALERSIGWISRVRRLARDYERLPETLAGLHFLDFAILMLKNVAEVHASRYDSSFKQPTRPPRNRKQLG